MQNQESLFQSTRSGEEDVAIAEMSEASSSEVRGAVFTRPEIVRATLDCAGYHAGSDLLAMRLLEPSFGGGEFLSVVLGRLIEAFLANGHGWNESLEVLGPRIVGVEVHKATFLSASARLKKELQGFGANASQAKSLTEHWLRCDDFLLTELDGGFDFVVGNPPYVRQERIPPVLLASYKERFSTLYDRADLYVLFYEKGLDHLEPGGILGYVCADRWTKNKYGGPLRAKVSDGFRLSIFVDLSGIDAFTDEVEAYASITVLQASSTGADVTSLWIPDEGKAVEGSTNGESLPGLVELGRRMISVAGIVNGSDPWLLDSYEVLPVLRDIEERFPTLEGSGAAVGIGVATGCDRVFIGDYDQLPVEDDRKLKLVLGRNCKLDGVEWSGKGVVNPYLPCGKLVDLAEYPLLSAYFQDHEEALRKRHVAKKSPSRWYKTIDRIDHALTTRAKLLVPDIKGSAMFTYEPGGYYPHHNLYVITSDEWDLLALQTVLRSSIALAFVAAYCTRMSGGYLRFQAQYLRRIRVPDYLQLSSVDRASLVTLSQGATQSEIDDFVFGLYGICGDDAQVVRTFAESSRRGKV
ncbi:MAG: Eco57I restriction-modification methylase domain-containing protein [Planctomycetes bacterium]|nr:Eco57I restriction-modification methylase domain-containing protein [Planctomycetota bacterium]